MEVLRVKKVSGCRYKTNYFWVALGSEWVQNNKHSVLTFSI